MAITKSPKFQRSDTVISAVSSKRKRKGAPKFPHLPEATAKKLKQQWVEKKKLQSSYFGKGKKKKQEKAAAAVTQTGGENEDHEDEDDEDEEVFIESDENASDDMGVDVDMDDDATLDDDYHDGMALAREAHISPQKEGYEDGASLVRAPAISPTSRVRASLDFASDLPKASRKEKARQEKEKAWQEKEKALALRSLSRAAHSPATLHTYKSQPLRKASMSGRPKDAKVEGKGRGKGQPDMKLRMGALLEKIKRNVGA